MHTQHEDDRGMDATESQLTELRRLGVAEAELEGLTAADADEWIDELRSRLIDAQRFAPIARPRNDRS